MDDKDNSATKLSEFQKVLEELKLQGRSMHAMINGGDRVHLELLQCTNSREAKLAAGVPQLKAVKGASQRRRMATIVAVEEALMTSQGRVGDLIRGTIERLA